MCKKSLVILSAITVLVYVVCSCTLETSNNGDLDGAWHLLAIDDKPIEQHPDLYWSFQNKLLELSDKSTECGTFLLRFSREGNKLKLSDPFIYDRENGDKPLEDATSLQPFGVYNTTETFDVVSLSASRMTLKSSTVKLDFRKF